MPDHNEIYSSKADKYEQLISKEDYQNNIKRTIMDICSIKGCDLIDIGAGTGRLSCLFGPLCKSIIAFDQSQAMLDVALDKFLKLGINNWKTQVADHRSLPIEDGSADVIMAGWTICYLCSTKITNWRDNFHSILQEMKRVVRKNGILIILETLGTGNEEPLYFEHLIGYFELLKGHGFSHKTIRTDYQFDSIEEGEDLIKFFFGDELASKFIRTGSKILPECTGIWWLRI